MKKLFFLSILTLFLFTACQKDNLPKDTPKCIEDEIKAFKASEFNCEGAVISSYDFLGETVYVFQSGRCIADGGARVLDSECTQVCFLGGIAGFTTCEGVDFESNASNRKILWKR